MQKILVFNMPDDAEEFKTASDGHKYMSALKDIDNWLRHVIKYDCDKLSDSQLEIYREVRKKVLEFISERGIDF